RVVLRKVERVRVDERTVPEHRREVALPGAQGAEKAGMPKPDVDRAIAAGTQALERALVRTDERRQVGVDPRNNVAHEVVLPDSGPLAVVRAYPRAGDRYDGDEGLRLSRGDQSVGHVGEMET